jgi:hypothetical protein
MHMNEETKEGIEGETRMHASFFESFADLLSLKLKCGINARGYDTYARRDDVFTVVDATWVCVWVVKAWRVMCGV